MLESSATATKNDLSIAILLFSYATRGLYLRRLSNGAAFLPALLLVAFLLMAGSSSCRL